MNLVAESLINSIWVNVITVKDNHLLTEVICVLAPKKWYQSTTNQIRGEQLTKKKLIAVDKNRNWNTWNTNFVFFLRNLTKYSSVHWHFWCDSTIFYSSCLFIVCACVEAYCLSDDRTFSFSASTNRLLNQKRNGHAKRWIKCEEAKKGTEKKSTECIVNSGADLTFHVLK